jgi:hypothetical protein
MRFLPAPFFRAKIVKKKSGDFMLVLVFGVG